MRALLLAFAACVGVACGGGDDDGGLDAPRSDGATANDGAAGTVDGATADGATVDGGPAALTFGFPVYTRAEIDGWSTASPEYTRLAGSWAGNVSRPHTTWGPEIDSVERDVWKDEMVYLKVEAVLWAADGDAARRDKVVAMLDALGEVTSLGTDPIEQYRLVAGWACTNVAQAAAIVGYRDAGLDHFLVDVAYPILDWTNGGNWQGSFSDSRLAIAAYQGDPALWADATAYYHRRIAQTIYHSAYDGGTVNPLRDSAGNPQVALTVSHWGAYWGAEYGQVNTDFTPVDPSLFVDGVDAERRRDPSHVAMGLGAWMHGARTILAQGDVLEPHARARLRAAYDYHAGRVLVLLDTGELPAPSTAQGTGGNAYRQSWYGARALFGDDTPANVITLLGRDEIQDYAAAGANHMVAEAFADGVP